MANAAHRKSPEGQFSRFGAKHAVVGIAAVAVVAIALGATAYATQHSSKSHGATTATGSSGSGQGGNSSTSTVPPPPPLSVVSISPAAATTNVASNAPITVQFSQTLKADAPRPTLTPAVAGTWTQSGATMTFQPSGGYLPYSTEQVTVPAGISATLGKRVITLAAADKTSFTAAAGSTTRVEQMLAELGYMPLQFLATPATTTTTAPATAAGAAATTPATTAPAATPVAPTAATTLATESTVADGVDVLPRAGTMTWRFPDTPASLTSLWTPGQSNVIDQGAIMAFENANGMQMDGVAGPEVWGALVKAVAARTVTTAPYNYLYANKAEPESLTVWENGKVIYTSAANTGVAGAPTVDGTWPVYDRAVSTTMTGTNPDGSKYVDPDIPYVSYFHGGDAVHGFDRASYGFPQSVGCVELPPANAKVVYNYDPYGTLVTVEG